MDRVLRVKEEYSCYTDFGLIDRLLDWLEREDGELEIIAGYGLCLATVTYFAARLVQALMRW
ncbi:MAG: hypothetical protein PHU36_09850 [Syntrophomonadaceae bacterium]|nr:hypothetical protein [Syntrophomonadaceae bacterium]